MDVTYPAQNKVSRVEESKPMVKEESKPMVKDKKLRSVWTLIDFVINILIVLEKSCLFFTLS